MSWSISQDLKRSDVGFWARRSLCIHVSADGWTHGGSEKSLSVGLIVQVLCKTSGHDCLCGVNRSHVIEALISCHGMWQGYGCFHWNWQLFGEFGGSPHFCTRKNHGW